MVVEQTDKERPMDCHGCCRNSVLLESFVVTLTLLSALATSIDLLVVFDLITVPESRTLVNGTDGLLTNGQRSTSELISENENVMDVLELVCTYTSLAVAGLFTIEIFFKVSTQRMDFLSSPMQVFDSLVVLLTLGSNVTFYLMEPPMDILLTICYVVLLRLWRIPDLCNMRAVRVRKTLMRDLERSEDHRTKTEEKCARLEEVITAHKNTIRKLDRALKTNSDASCGTEITVNGKNSPSTREQKDLKKQLRHSYHGSLEENNNTSSHSCSLARSGQVKTHQLRKPKKTIDSKKDTDIELAKFGETATRFPKESSDVVLIEETSLSSAKSRDGDGDGPPRRSSDINRDEAASQLNVDKIQRQKFHLTSNSPRPSPMNFKQRKRRSSTSEVIDYSNLNSPEKEDVFVGELEDKTQSCLELDRTDNSNKLVGVNDNDNSCETHDTIDRSSSSSSGSSQNADSVDGKDHGSYTVKQKDSSSSDAPSESSSQNNLIGQRSRKDKREYRRFTSCPEFVYTQRMSITKDDSKLMDDHTSDDQTMFDNLAFDYDEDARMQILAEFDGSKTYRSEDGIPMTSL